jgi:hypothetical protein
VRDHRDKRVLHLLFELLLGDIADVGDRAAEFAGWATLDGVAALDIEPPPIAGGNPALDDRVRLGGAALQRAIHQADVRPLGILDRQHLGAGPADRLLARPARQPLHGPVEGRDPPAAIEDHHAIGALLDDRVELLFLAQRALVEPGVADGDRGLVGESAQELLIVAREGDVDGGAEDIDHAHLGPAEDQRQRDHLPQRQLRVGGDLLQPPGQYALLVQRRGQEILEHRPDLGRKMGRSLHVQPAVLLAQRDQARRSSEQVDGHIDHQIEHAGQVELGGERPADPQQEFKLS